MEVSCGDGARNIALIDVSSVGLPFEELTSSATA